MRLIVGERRWRAAQKAGLKEVPVLVKEMEEREALEISLIENFRGTTSTRSRKPRLSSSDGGIQDQPGGTE